MSVGSTTAARRITWCVVNTPCGSAARSRSAGPVAIAGKRRAASVAQPLGIATLFLELSHGFDFASTFRRNLEGDRTAAAAKVIWFSSTNNIPLPAGVLVHSMLS
jgi:hypothetical protein